MLRRLIPLLLPLLLLLPAGCASRASRSAMDRAETLMDSLPDSALAILRAIDPQSLATPFSDEPRARHALLLSQALDKNYIDIADDSIISVAYDYYAPSPGADPRRRMMAFYYRGVVCYNAGDPSSAIYNFTIADALASRIGDYRYRGLANSRIALSFSKFSDLRRELDHSLRGLRFFRLAADSANIKRLMLNVGLCYIQVEEYDSAMSMFEMLDVRTSLYGRAVCLIESDNIDAYHRLVAQYPDYRQPSALLCRYADKMTHNGDFEKATAALARAKACAECRKDSLNVIYSESLLASKLGNWEEFAESVNRMNNDNVRYSRRIKTLYSPDASGLAKDFLNNAELSEVRKTGQKLKIAILILTVILLCSCLIVVISRLKAREMEISLLRRLAEMDRASRQTSSDFMSALESVAAEKKKLNERIVSLENERKAADGFVTELREVMTLYDEYLHTPLSQGFKATKKKLIQQAASLSNPEFEDSLVRFTDIRHNSVITRLKELGYNRNERVLLCCLLNEFPVGLISLLFNVDSTVIYTRKSRLKAKLQSSGITNLPCF